VYSTEHFHWQLFSKLQYNEVVSTSIYNAILSLKLFMRVIERLTGCKLKEYICMYVICYIQKIHLLHILILLTLMFVVSIIL